MTSNNCRIITFYSYKGGTGRSMALANVAWVLAANRKRVLVIDWDLEAPGLHRYFRPFLIDEQLTSSEGLIDFVMSFADEVIKPEQAETRSDWFEEHADITPYALSINFDRFPKPGRIDLVPAGRQGPGYATRVSVFDWQNFYDRLGGGAFFEALKRRMREEYDYVLIDSRTGVSDTAGICTVQMPDTLAVCFTYNNQSIEGASGVAHSARMARRQLRDETDSGTLQIFPIPTRVDQAEADMLQARQMYARSQFEDLIRDKTNLDAYWKAVEIPYVAVYSYEELLAPFRDELNDPKNLLGAIVRITDHLTGSDVRDFHFPISPDEKLRVRQAFAVTPVSDGARPVVEAESAIQQKVRGAEAVFLQFSTTLQVEARRVLTRLVRVARHEDGGNVKQRVRVKDFGKSESAAVRSLAGVQLIKIEKESESNEDVAEIADEVLIQEWPRLRNWLEEDFNFLIWRQGLREQIREWEGHNRKHEFLLRGLYLLTAQKWVSEHVDDINEVERDFIDRAIRMEREAPAEASGSSVRAFIIRPFGKRDGIDFDEVERRLIVPALELMGIQGRATIDLISANNIRLDMFRRLLTSDLIIADLSMHNAEVFYSLGIRHALRESSTLMLRSNGSSVPFDLQTERYFVYSQEEPSESLPALVEALRLWSSRRTRDVKSKDSPVFAMFPNLTEPDFTLFNLVPQDFGEEVERAAAGRRRGDLALISYEVKGFEWETSGWRRVGTAQFYSGAFLEAKTTWENVRKLEPQDIEANLRLGTIYERLGDLVRSTEALERALNNKAIKQNERAEVYSLLARNSKTRWRHEWEGKPPADRPAEALRSAFLQDSFEHYERAFDEDLNHFFSGLNALAMIKITVELATMLPEVWAERFKSDRKANEALEECSEHAAKLASAVDLSLAANEHRLEREGSKDIWAEISAADLMFLTTDAPLRVATAYRKVMSGAPNFASGAVLKQLAIYRDLGVLSANLTEVFKVLGEPPPLVDPCTLPTISPERQRVLVFSGHMIDAPDRKNPRFPATSEQLVREKIKEAVIKEMNTGAGVLCGYAGAASGGDILFQEVCAELGIPTRLYLAIPPAKYVNTSVVHAGPAWVDRFWNIYNRHMSAKQLRILSEAESEEEIFTRVAPVQR